MKGLDYRVQVNDRNLQKVATECARASVITQNRIATAERMIENQAAPRDNDEIRVLLKQSSQEWTQEIHRALTNICNLGEQLREGVNLTLQQSKEELIQEFRMDLGQDRVQLLQELDTILGRQSCENQNAQKQFLDTLGVVVGQVQEALLPVRTAVSTPVEGVSTMECVHHDMVEPATKPTTGQKGSKCRKIKNRGWSPRKSKRLTSKNRQESASEWSKESIMDAGSETISKERSGHVETTMRLRPRPK